MRSNQWAITKRSYYVDILLVPMLWLAALFYSGLNERVLAGAAIGWFVWTFLEWAIHRFVFHRLYRKEHAAHHRWPDRFIGVPWYQTESIIVCVWLALVQSFSLYAGTGLWLGLVVGYYSYIIAHDRFHHGRPDTWRGYWREQYERHAMHHRGVEKNFGVTTRLWDVLLGTSKKS